MRIITLFLMLTVSSLVFAEDVGGGGGGYSGSSSESNDSRNTEMVHARRFLKRDKYKAAIQSLNLVVQQDHRNADALNLLGYSHRKLGNLKRSGKYYKRALKVNPEHKGALEYQGELFLMLEDVAAAQQNLQKLEELCPDGCEELTTLRQAVANAES